MGSFLCLCCGEVYKQFENGVCPKKSCSGTVVDANDFLVPVLQTLLKCGYIVKNSYISPVSEILETDLEKDITVSIECSRNVGVFLTDEVLGNFALGLPKGFKIYTTSFKTFVITSVRSVENQVEGIKAISELCTELLNWAQKVRPLIQVFPQIDILNKCKTVETKREKKSNVVLSIFPSTPSFENLEGETEDEDTDDVVPIDSRNVSLYY